MNSAEVLKSLDESIRSQSILDHPFYVAWKNGKLSRDDIAAYAEVYYPHVAAFPGYLERAIGCTTDPTIVSILRENLSDELHNPKPHHELWLSFAEEFGLNRHEVQNGNPHPVTVSTVEAFNRLTSESIGSALSALYAYESQQPEVSREKIEGLRQHYGVPGEKGIEYFSVHEKTDIEHSKEEREALNRALLNGASGASILTAARQALDAYWVLLDGICEAVSFSPGN